MKTIELTKGKVAIVDDADFEWLNQWSWMCSRKGYAVRGCYVGNYRQITLSMHRLVLDAPAKMQVDHINGDKLDNRRENLRLATNGENQRNRLKTKANTTSKYKGVYRRRSNNKWCARIRLNMKDIHLGNFHSEVEAAKAYDKAAKELFGEFARLNLPQEVFQEPSR